MFKLRKSNKVKQTLKPGDYVAIRNKDWDNKDEWQYRTRIWVVKSVNGDEVTYGEDGYSWKININQCVKIADEEVERYIKLKGSDSRVAKKARVMIPKKVSDKVSIGDTINTNYYSELYNGRDLSGFDYTVLGIDNGLVVCTRLNKGCDIFIIPKESCYRKEDASDVNSNEKDQENNMSDLEDSMIDLEVRESWWEQGEAVMREMTEDD